MSNDNFYLGIDLGTTNSTISLINIDNDGKIIPKTLDIEQVDDYGLGFTYDPIVPSALYIDETGVKNVGKYAIKMLDTYPKRVLREAKRHIGVLRDGRPAEWNINEEIFTPEMVSSYVLKKLKKEAEKHLQREVDSVVITVPANFNFNQVGATRMAAKLAGFHPEKIYTLAEPTAALIDYLNEEKQKSKETRRLYIGEESKKLLVFDLGGGTCDVSIMEVSEDSQEKINIKELSVSQYTELGGVDFDNIIVNRLLLPKLMKAKNISPREIRQLSQDVSIVLQSNLKRVAENAKKYFARIVKSRIDMDEINYFDNSEQCDDIKYREMIMGLPTELTCTFEITKKEYDMCIKEFLYVSPQGKDIESPILNALKYANLSINDIDQVFLVGGMTNYPTIQKRIYEIFNKRIKPIASINPMFSVSRGASVYNYHKGKISIAGPGESNAGRKDVEGDIDVESILPDNIYINVLVGDPIPLLEKGTQAGSSKIIEDKFFVSDKSGKGTITEMDLNLFSAESAISMKRVELKSAILKFKKPVQSGTRISIKAEYTENREVVVSAWLTDDETEKINVEIGSNEISIEKQEDIKNDNNIR